MNAPLARFGSTALLALLSAAAHAQPLDAPPRLPAADQPGAPRHEVVRAPERAARRASEVEPLAEPAPDEQLPPAVQTAPEARIEQRRRGNRVVEVIVTPARSTTTYVIVNREGARPLSQQELSAGLSVPRFLRLEF